MTSDNISPLHLMDIKRVAFETRPATAPAEPPVQSWLAQSPQPPHSNLSAQPRIDSRERETIAALVDRFMAARRQPPSTEETPNVAHREPEASTNNQPQAATPALIDKIESNGHRAVDFVCEEDVKRAIAAGEKIYVNARTIITPAARELGEQREVFAIVGR